MRQDDRVIHWFCRFEKILVRLVIAGAVMLVLAQAVVEKNPNAGLLDMAGLEEYMPVTANVKDHGNTIIMTFELLDASSLSKAKILVDGSPAADFSERYVTVKVAPGELVEIDGAFYERPFRVKLLDVYPIVAKPVKGQIHKIKQEKHPVGKVETE
jgi:hypothetical protein